MKSYKTNAIILKRFDMGETDRLYTLFSENLGKVRAIAKGVRKPLSKMAGHLEPYTLSACQLSEGRNFYTLTSADTTFSFPGLRNRLTKTSLAYFLLETVDSLVVDAERHPAVYQLLSESLQLLEHLPTEANDRILMIAFTFRLMAELGYLPELTLCVNCSQQLQPLNNRFSLTLGGIIDGDCFAADRQAIGLSVDSIKALRLLASEPISIAYRLQIKSQVIKELEEINSRYLQFQSGRAINSADFIRLSHLKV